MYKALERVKQVLYKISMAVGEKKYARDLVVLGLLLNLADALFTLYYVRNGLATEANPLMAYYLDHSDSAFLIVKMYMATIGIAIMYMYRDRKAAMVGLWGAMAVYSLVVGNHLIWGLIWMLRG